MNSVLFSTLLSGIVFIIAIGLYKWIKMLDIKAMVFSLFLGCLFGILSFGIMFFVNVEKAYDASKISQNYLINTSIDTSDEEIEEYIKEIFQNELKHNLKDIKISSCLYDKALIRVVKVKASIGDDIYNNYDFKYKVDLKTKKLYK